MPAYFSSKVIYSNHQVQLEFCCVKIIETQKKPLILHLKFISAWLIRLNCKPDLTIQSNCSFKSPQHNLSRKFLHRNFSIHLICLEVSEYKHDSWKFGQVIGEWWSQDFLEGEGDFQKKSFYLVNLIEFPSSPKPQKNLGFVSQKWTSQNSTKRNLWLGRGSNYGGGGICFYLDPLLYLVIVGCLGVFIQKKVCMKYRSLHFMRSSKVARNQI